MWPASAHSSSLPTSISASACLGTLNPQNPRTSIPVNGTHTCNNPHVGLHRNAGPGFCGASSASGVCSSTKPLFTAAAFLSPISRRMANPHLSATQAARCQRQSRSRQPAGAGAAAQNPFTPSTTLGEGARLGHGPLLDDLLVAALHGAVAREDGGDAAVLVADELDLQVAALRRQLHAEYWRPGHLALHLLERAAHVVVRPAPARAHAGTRSGLRPAPARARRARCHCRPAPARARAGTRSRRRPAPARTRRAHRHCRPAPARACRQLVKTAAQHLRAHAGTWSRLRLSTGAQPCRHLVKTARLAQHPLERAAHAVHRRPARARMDAAACCSRAPPTHRSMPLHRRPFAPRPPPRPLTR